MYKVKFDNGYVVSFDNEPTQADIDAAAQHMSDNIKPSPAPEQPKGFWNGVKNVIAGTGQGGYNVLKDTMNTGAKLLETAAKQKLDQIVPGGSQVLKMGLDKVGINKDTPGPGDLLQSGIEKMRGVPQGSLTQSQNPTQQAFNTGTQVAAALAPIGGSAEAGAAALARTPEQITAAKLANSEKVGKIVDTIIQSKGKTKDIIKAKKVLSEIDTTGVKTFQDLASHIGDWKDTLLSKVDELTSADKSIHPLKDLKVKAEVNGKTVSYNYVNRALSHLSELYKKTSDLVGQETIKQLKDKASTDGLTIDEINKLARTYGTEIGQKAFNKGTGEQLTSINSGMFENIRTGLKDTVKQFSSDETAKAIDTLDQQASNAIRTQKLVNTMAEKTAALASKIKDENMVMKAGRIIGKTAGKAVDLATGGSVRAFLTSFLPSNVGNKIMNSVDLQSALRKNLIEITKLNKASGENFFNGLSRWLSK